MTNHGGNHVVESDHVEVEQHEKDPVRIRNFRLLCNDVEVHLSSLGASITKFLVPSSKSFISDPTSDNGTADGMDDIVLGYPSVREMYLSRNPVYFGVIVGRVANRIARGKLQLPRVDVESIQLDINNEPNHLHGGSQGFSHKVWDAQILPNNEGVQFILLSPDGDGGYPGTIQVTATYKLLEGPESMNEQEQSDSFSAMNHVQLSLTMEAKLLGDAVPCTPVNFAQHSYFNLNGHNDPRGILDHKLHLDGCVAYTPVDEHSIPTRQVVPLTNEKSMDFQSEPVLFSHSLVNVGVDIATLPRDRVLAAVNHRNLAIDVGNVHDEALPPFGVDHNFVVKAKDEKSLSASIGEEMVRIATVTHAHSQRRLVVSTTAPGVQVYTANYLSTSPTDGYKDAAQYQPWQGFCLETQHYPDSIGVDTEKHPEFARGQCVSLSPARATYTHKVLYDFDFPCSPKRSSTSKSLTPVLPSTFDANDDDFSSWGGRDTENNRYESIQAMWESQGVTGSFSSLWYHKAHEHYLENCAPTVDGVLGGFAPLSKVDLAGSMKFVQNLQQLGLLSGRDLAQAVACECGAGIGRVSKGLLLPLGFGHVDLVESASHLLAAAPDFIGDEGGANKCRYYCTALQDWAPSQPEKYTLIWVQWVFCYLHDEDAIRFLKQCRSGLVQSGGLIVLKENTVGRNDEVEPDGVMTVSGDKADDFVLDLEDASVTRSVRYLVHLAKVAGLKVVHIEESQDFPSDNFPVPTIAFSPVQD